MTARLPETSAWVEALKTPSLCAFCDDPKGWLYFGDTGKAACCQGCARRIASSALVDEAVELPSAPPCSFCGAEFNADTGWQYGNTDGIEICQHCCERAAL